MIPMTPTRGRLRAAATLGSEAGLSGTRSAVSEEERPREAVCVRSGRCAVVIDEGGCRENIKGKCRRDLDGCGGAFVSSDAAPGGCFDGPGIAFPCAGASSAV